MFSVGVSRSHHAPVHKNMYCAAFMCLKMAKKQSWYLQWSPVHFSRDVCRDPVVLFYGFFKGPV